MTRKKAQPKRAMKTLNVSFKKQGKTRAKKKPYSFAEWVEQYVKASKGNPV